MSVYLIVLIGWIAAVMLPLSRLYMNRQAKKEGSKFADPNYRAKARIVVITISCLILLTLILYIKKMTMNY